MCGSTIAGRWSGTRNLQFQYPDWIVWFAPLPNYAQSGFESLTQGVPHLASGSTRKSARGALFSRAARQGLGHSRGQYSSLSLNTISLARPRFAGSAPLEVASHRSPFSSLSGLIKYNKTPLTKWCFIVLAARQGLEPRYLGPKPSVLPLDDRASGSIYTIYCSRNHPQ